MPKATLKLVTKLAGLAPVTVSLVVNGTENVSETPALHQSGLAVAPLDLEGGQAQFIQFEVPGSPSNLAPLLAWSDKHSHQSLSIDALAEHAAMSTRTFIRRFREQTGTTPLRWILSSRVRHAQELLEKSQLSIDEVGLKTDFDNPANFRERSWRTLRVSPKVYRRAFSSRQININKPRNGS